jgi:type VI secretion system secreted protein Hcp
VNGKDTMQQFVPQGSPVVLAGASCPASSRSLLWCGATTTPTPSAAKPTASTPVPSPTGVTAAEDHLVPQPALSSPAETAAPGYQIFVKIDGILGEFRDDKHVGWIEAVSFSHSISPPASGTATTGGLRTLGPANHQDFKLVRVLDKASPKLALFCSNGGRIKEVTIELYRATGEKQKFMEWNLSDVVVTSVSPHGSVETGDTLPLEEVSLAYSRITWTYTETNPHTGKPKGEIMQTGTWPRTRVAKGIATP